MKKTSHEKENVIISYYWSWNILTLKCPSLFSVSSAPHFSSRSISEWCMHRHHKKWYLLYRVRLFYFELTDQMQAFCKWHSHEPGITFDSCYDLSYFEITKLYVLTPIPGFIRGSAGTHCSVAKRLFSNTPQYFDMLWLMWVWTLRPGSQIVLR